jgi:L-seryl-tRNA(Ser) seleniumtransferase
VARRLRDHEPPVIARIHDGDVVLDPRTLTDEELGEVVLAARDALGER